MNNIIINGPADQRVCLYCGQLYISRGKNDPGYCKDCERKMKATIIAPSNLSGGKESYDKVENYVKKAINIANDDTHGYSMQNRDGYPDYDCSSLVCHVVQEAGIPVMENGASYTGNMREAFLKSGFVNVTSQVNLGNCTGMVRGDILLHDQNHTAIYIGNKQIVQAGGPNGHPEPGDQTGEEIKTMNYYNYPWSCVLRFPHDTATADFVYPDEPISYSEHINNEDYPEILKYADWGGEVKNLQNQLRVLGYYRGELDGKFGEQTLAAVMQFQEKNRLAMDGEVGPLTKAALKEKFEEVEDKVTGVVELGELVKFKGGKARISANVNFGKVYDPGLGKITAVRLGTKYPYHLAPVRDSEVYGWVSAEQIEVLNNGRY